MKALVGWLGDPYLHLFGIGLIVLAIGAAMTSEAARSSGSEPCERCQKPHDESVACNSSVLSTQNR